MAVPQNRQTRSRRDKRRSHDSVSLSALTTDGETGEIHMRHCMTPDGFYRGRQVVAQKDENDDE